MEFDIGILSTLGIDTKTGIEYTGGNDRYISALQRYYKSSTQNKQKISEFLNANDWDNLAIIVHALKSNSRMIGSSSLGEKFELLEKACTNKEADTVRSNIDVALNEYDIILEVLKPLGEAETFKAEGEIGGDEAKAIADQLLQALDDFDDELSAELVNKLSGYPFRITQKGKLREAADFISDFLYDEAAEIIKEIYPAIE